MNVKSALFISTATLMLGITSCSQKEFRVDLPVNCSIGKDCFIQNYVDQAKGEDHYDYRCRKLSYDGHKGTDFRLGIMDMSQPTPDILAMAPGVVARIRDSEPDALNSRKSLESYAGKDCGNGMVIEHAGGWETQYCHMRGGSISVSEGEQVESGDRLGMMGLSGNTEFPHIHVSIRNPEGEIVDPFNARPMESGCAPATKQLWSEAAQKRIQTNGTGLLAMGIAPKPVNVSDVLEGRYQSMVLDDQANMMIFWSLSFGAKKEDALSMILLAPDGSVVVEHEHIFPSFKAQYLQFIGRKLRKGTRWGHGNYELHTSLKRNGETIFQKITPFTVAATEPETSE